MSDLSEKILEAIAADEEAAQEAIANVGDGHWRLFKHRPGGKLADIKAGNDQYVAGRYAPPPIGHPCVRFAAAVHVVRHDPESVLRRCAADLEIVDLYVDAAEKCGEIEAIEKQRGLRPSEIQAAGIADVYRIAYRAALVRLARGYGVQPTPGGDHV